MKNKRLVTLIGSVCLVLVLAALPFMTACPAPKPAPPPPEEVTPTPPAPPEEKPIESIVLSYATSDPEFGWSAERIVKPWFADIGKATGGRVKMQPYWSSSLVGVLDVYDAVVKGTADTGFGLTTLIPGKFPMSEVINIPKYDRVCWKPNRVYWELFQKFPEMRAPFADAKVLWIGCSSFTPIATVKKPIRRLEDNQGMKMIVTGKLNAMRGEALGWTPVAVKPTEVYVSYQRGLADGGSTGVMYFMEDRKLVEVLKYVTLVPSTRIAFFCIMNLDKWNSLPPDIQKAIEEVSGEPMIDRQDREHLLDFVSGQEQFPKEYGIEMIRLSPAELARWVETDKPVVEAFIADLEAKGLPSRELYEEFDRLEAKYSAEEYAVKK